MEANETTFIYYDRSSKKQNFDKRLIAHIVQLVEQGVPRRNIIQQYGMANSTLCDWLDRYGSKASKIKRYTQAEKRSVVRAIEAGMSIKQAQVSFNISYPSVIRRWIKNFEQEKAELCVHNPQEMAKKTLKTEEGLELKALKKALEEANLKVKALDTLIDIAEEQLKIDIRKKSGAKQSSK